MTIIKENCTFLGWSPVTIESMYYVSPPRRAIQAWLMHDGAAEPLLTASVNLPSAECPDGEVWIKDWAENEGVLDWLIAKGIIEAEVRATWRSGYVIATRHRFTEEVLAQLAAADAKESEHG